MASLNLERIGQMSVYETISIMIAFCELQITILIFIITYIADKDKK
ncbi:putative holin-like toxin [Staphylococcus debuckii]|uniref:Holin-like toxin n=1 Tax=Staphylococcus debuckii TaxID=2044912 RepID=A0ABU9EUZ6_9STAP|nr:putative holin-like toxin [Staphylococcus debuckii]AYU54242.1 hypothetical protein CNQ82_01815 [Staphylococcus debuckii]